MLGYIGIFVGPLCSVCVLLHVQGLAWPKDWPYGKRCLAALPFALVNLFLMRDVFSTPWMLCVFLSLTLAAVDIFAWVLRPVDKKRVLSRLKRHGLAFFLALLVCAYGLLNMRLVRMTEYTLETDKFPGTMRLGLLSDIHLGCSLDADDVSEQVDRLSDAGANIIIFAGDVVDERTEEAEFERLCDLLSEKQAPMVYVFGNHDANGISRSVICEQLEDAGVRVLQDARTFLFGNFCVIGRSEAGRSRLTENSLLRGLNESVYTVMIDHQPARTRECAQAGVDLLLAGHTHNGQIWPVNIISEILHINEIEYGHKTIGTMDAIVSSGASGWRCAVRTAGHSECVLITINGNISSESCEI